VRLGGEAGVHAEVVLVNFEERNLGRKGRRDQRFKKETKGADKARKQAGQAGANSVEIELGIGRIGKKKQRVKFGRKKDPTLRAGKLRKEVPPTAKRIPNKHRTIQKKVEEENRCPIAQGKNKFDKRTGAAKKRRQERNRKPWGKNGPMYADPERGGRQVQPVIKGIGERVV